MGSGGGTSTQTTVQELSPEQRQLIEPVIPIARDYVKNPPQMFPGSGISGFNPLQQLAQQMTMNSAQGFMPMMQQMPGMLQALQGGWGSTINAAGGQGARGQGQLDKILGAQAASTNSPGLDFFTSGAVLNPQSNAALRGAIQNATRPIMENFRESILPSIASESISAGGYGGSRQGIAQGLAARGASNAVGDVASQMANQNYQAGLQAMLQGLNTEQNALGQLIQGQLGGQQAAQGWLSQQQGGLQGLQGLLGQQGNLMQQSLMPINMIESVGAQNQAMEQARLTEQVQRFVNEQMMPFAIAQDVAAMAFGMPGGTTKTTATGGQSGNMGAQLGMGALSILPALIGKSDRKLKREVREIGKLYDGLKVYSFKLKDELIERIGLMADEVLELYPLAVLDNGSYMMVRYDLVPSWHTRGVM